MEVEALIKTTSPKILYLKINALSKIIAQNPLNDYLKIETTSKLIDGYLRDYESLPDNEDKYRDIYKISETFKMYPQTEKEFLSQKTAIEEKRQQEIAQQKAIEAQKIIDEANRKRTLELAEIRRKKDARYSGGGFGYYAGVNSLIGFSFSGVAKGLNFGLDVRVSNYYLLSEVMDYQESSAVYAASDYKMSTASLAALINLNHPIIYPLYGYVGVGYGTRTDYVASKSEKLREVQYETEGVETEFGVFLKAGSVGVFRAGLSYNDFDFDFPEFTFGFIFHY